jgi:hypothetical protein
MLKRTLEKDYYYEILDTLEDQRGYSAEYIFNAFLQSMSGDQLYEELEYFLRTHDIDLEEDGDNE